MSEVIWITGASSGIGRSLALAYARNGTKLILSSRNQTQLETVRASCSNPENIKILSMDLELHAELEVKVSDAIRCFGKIDRVILNGGISQRALAKDTSLDVSKRLMNINYFGNIEITKHLLKHFDELKSGHIVVVTSLTGKFGTAYRSSYAASKHACHGFFDSLRAEHAKNGIDVTILCPGFIKTNISLNALTGDGKNLGTMDDAQNRGMHPDVFAKIAIKTIYKRKYESYIGGKEVIGIYLKRFFPNLFTQIISKAKVR